ncbi:MAG: ComEC/Rec2 family competence protein [Cyanobacteria bacterium J06631_12]
MAPWGTIVIAAAYLTGLLVTGITESRTIGGISNAGLILLAVGVVCSLTVPQRWRMGASRRHWMAAGVVGLVAASYCIARIPQPAPDDISRFASGHERQVIGEVLQMPQTSRDEKGRFFLQARSVRGVGSDRSIEAPRPVSGKLYVSAPLEPSKQLYPGQIIGLKGEVYAIRQRDEEKSGFGEYLSRKGCFSGFRSHWIEFIADQTPPRWALWKLRARVVTAQDRWLGEPAGNLVSAMTLGRKAVDLPYEVRDSFIAAGLAHTLAASGFHVSLLLALVLGALKTRRPQTRAIAGASALLIYVGLTGLQPSVIRASLMGAGVLLGLATKQKVNPLGGLLTAAMLILLVNPQWIWDVGFQLSVVATLGLILTVGRIMRLLEWMPTTVAAMLAVPIAAYLWTIPLQLLYFQKLPIYSIFLNAVATPLVIVISTGGFISAIAASLMPIAGSFIAANLYYPVHLLIWLVNKFNQLPGSSIEITGVKGWHVVLSYAIYLAICVWIWQRDSQNQGHAHQSFIL